MDRACPRRNRRRGGRGPVTTAISVRIEAEQYDDPKVLYDERRGRARAVKAVSVARGPIVANARSAPAAKAAFAACVEAVLDNLGDPQLLALGGYVGVVWMTVCGGGETVEFRYRILHPDGAPGGSLFGFATAEEAERSCRLHLSQYATDYFDDDSVFAAWHFLLPDQRHDHLRYAAWQRARRAAEQVECADKHRWASEHQDEYLPLLVEASDSRHPSPAG